MPFKYVLSRFVNVFNSRSFDMSLFDLIKELEGAEEEIYADSKGIPSVGVGFNLRQSNVLFKLLEHFGFQELSDDFEAKLLVDLRGIFGRNWEGATDAQIAQWRTDADNALAAAATGLPEGSTPRLTFELANEEGMANVVEAIRADYEFEVITGIDRHLPGDRKAAATLLGTNN